jgi:hypothetical protein
MSRSAFVTTLLAVSVLGLGTVGCAAAADSSDGDVAGSQAALFNDSSLVGKYYDSAVPSGGIARITLGSDGTYTASVDPAGTIQCMTAPCLLQESGTWSMTKGTVVSLSLVSQGAPVRSFTVKKIEGQLELTAHGRTQKLTELDADQCLDSSDCAEDSVCAPRVCAMMCASGSPFCCGVSTCKAKSAE